MLIWKVPKQNCVLHQGDVVSLRTHVKPCDFVEVVQLDLMTRSPCDRPSSPRREDRGRPNHGTLAASKPDRWPANCAHARFLEFREKASKGLHPIFSPIPLNQITRDSSFTIDQYGGGCSCDPSDWNTQPINVLAQSGQVQCSSAEATAIFLRPRQRPGPAARNSLKGHQASRSNSRRDCRYRPRP